jgi:pyruvate kinase
MNERALDEVRRRSLAKPGDAVVVLAGTPLGVPGTTNLLRVERIT